MDLPAFSKTLQSISGRVNGNIFILFQFRRICCFIIVMNEQENENVQMNWRNRRNDDDLEMKFNEVLVLIVMFVT